MESIKFSIGSGFANLLITIAREKITQEYNPQKAIKTITNTLIGINEQQALDLLSGKITLQEDIEEQQIYVVFINDSNWSFKTWLEYKINDLHKISEDYLEMLSDCQERIYARQGIYKIEVKYSEVFSYFWNKESINNIISDPNFEFVEFLVSSGRTLLEELDKVSNIRKWLITSYSELFCNNESSQLDIDFKSVSQELYSMTLGNSVLDRRITKSETQEELLDKYLTDEKAILETLSKDFFSPVNILDKYDAGWLSPKGIFYGLNGQGANALHIRIADKLQLTHIIRANINQTPESWLEDKGWIKIARNWILYAGYHIDVKDDVDITQKQIDVICNYIDSCHNSKLLIGYTKYPISTSAFRALDKPMLRKHFLNL